MSKDTRPNNLAFTYKVKRGHQGSIFIRLSRLLSEVPALLATTDSKWAGCNSKWGKEVGEFRPLDSHCRQLWDIQFQSVRLIASPSPPHLPPCWPLSTFLYLSGLSKQEPLFCSILLIREREPANDRALH